MRIIRECLSWTASLALIFSTAGLEGCGAKDTAPASTAQTNAAPAQAGATNAPAPGNAASAPQDNGAAPAAAQQAMYTPEMNLTPDGLDELLSPIALYPDPVLAVVLQASTNPQEVMDGGNWLAITDNQNLKEAALDQASSKAGFTPVMQALLHYPTVVDLMCTQFDWTKQLGAAYAADPKSVLAAVQRLRAQAVDSGVLKTSPQMKVEVKQDQGQQIVALEPANPKVVYVPQYNPEQVFSQPATTTTTSSDGRVTTTTTTNGSSTNTTTVVKEKEGVSTGTAVLVGLLSFGAGIAVGAAINNNNYYYPAWGYGGVYYGPHPYYPPPYRPYYGGYGGAWGGGYNYNRPVHYGNNNIYINNSNNYYNRFHGNNNLQPNYRPTQYNNYRNPNSGVYAKNYGNQPAYKNNVHYQPKNDNRYNNANNMGNRPGVNPGNQPNNMQRPSGGNQQLPAQRPAPGNANNGNNWKGQQTYQGNRGGNANNAGNAQRPSVGNQPANMQRPAPGGANAGNMQRPSPGTQPGNAQRPNINTPSGSNVDRGWGNQGSRPSTGNAQASRPSTGNMQNTRPAPSQNQPQARPAPQPSSRPAPSQNQMQSRPSSQPSGGGAFGGANNAKADRSASSRGRSSMGAQPMQQQHAGGAKKK